MIWLNTVFELIVNPFSVGSLIFILFIKKSKISLNNIEILLIVMLIFQLSMFIEILLDNIIYNDSNTHFINMADNNINNNTNNNTNTNSNAIPNDNIPRTRENPDYARLIRYITANVAALANKRPITRAIGIAVANGGNILADVVSSEERANYWIDQYNFYRINGRLRGGQSGSGPFERGTNPFDNPNNSGPLEGGSNPFDNINNSDTSNYVSHLDIINKLFSPVEHSIPLDTLINVHFILMLGLFVIVFCLILLYVFFCVNLIIIFNKDFILNKVKNKYAILYVKYILFKSRLDIVVISIFIISSLCFILYILHYLIIHPILVNT